MSASNYLYVLIFVLIMLGSCADKTFDYLPTTILNTGNSSSKNLMSDSVKIDAGLFYRKLSENGYSDIYGFRKLVLPEKALDKPFEIILLSCRKDDARQMLVTTIHPKYHSIIDVMAFDPGILRIESIAPSHQMPSFIDIKLTEKIQTSSAVDTTLMQINPKGGIEEMQLCCDF